MAGTSKAGCSNIGTLETETAAECEECLGQLASGKEPPAINIRSGNARGEAVCREHTIRMISLKETAREKCGARAQHCLSVCRDRAIQLRSSDREEGPAYEMF